MKQILISFLGFFVLTACGSDDKIITTQELICTSDSYYHYDDNKYYLNKNDRRECKFNIDPEYSDNGWHCAHGQVAARVENNGHNKRVYGGIGWEWTHCSSINGGPACHSGRNDIHNVRDRNRYHVHRDDYFRRNRNFYEDGYRVICVDRDDRHLHEKGGVWYYEYHKKKHSSLSTEEALTFTALGALLGIAVSSF